MLSVLVKKLDPFFIEHNFSKYCPILIILSLLQTEIICPQALNFPLYLQFVATLPWKMQPHILLHKNCCYKAWNSGDIPYWFLRCCFTTS